MKKNYALYKGDNFLGIGDIEKLSKDFNIKKKTLLFYKAPSYLKRTKKSRKGNYRVLVSIDEE